MNDKIMSSSPVLSNFMILFLELVYDRFEHSIVFYIMEVNFFNNETLHSFYLAKRIILNKRNLLLFLMPIILAGMK